jgi:tetratricopeptide (TPR) repeat protein
LLNPNSNGKLVGAEARLQRGSAGGATSNAGVKTLYEAQFGAERFGNLRQGCARRTDDAPFDAADLSLGNNPEAQARFEEALGIGRGIGDRRLEGLWLGNLGHAALEVGDYPQAQACFEEAFCIARDIDDCSHERWCVDWLGNVAANLGDYLKAEACFEEALRISREVGDCSHYNWFASGLSRVTAGSGEYPAAGSALKDP